MPVIVDTQSRTWTYGVEHELADWDTRKGWEGYGRDPEPNICNSNGIAADPRLISYPFGAEINTPPSDSPEEQGELFAQFQQMHTDAKANWRCGLHVHIRAPGLAQSLPHLKHLATYVNSNTDVYGLVDPLPRENVVQHGDHSKAARRRYNWMRMSHFTKIPDYRVEAQNRATSLKEFFELEVPRSKQGKPLWHAQPRAAVNLRQLLQTETIEFRHFPQTDHPSEVITAVEWCRDYLLAAFDTYPAVKLFQARYATAKFPELETIYTHWQEQRWLATTVTKQSRTIVEANIRRFLDEDAKAGC